MRRAPKSSPKETETDFPATATGAPRSTIKPRQRPQGTFEHVGCPGPAGAEHDHDDHVTYTACVSSGDPVTECAGCGADRSDFDPGYADELKAAKARRRGSRQSSAE